jgi:hypothetical protein
MKQTIILGAGASFGHGLKNEKRPPLGSGFFNNEYIENIICNYSPLLKYLKENVGIDVLNNERIDIERLYSEIEAIWKLLPNLTECEIIDNFGKDFTLVSTVDYLKSIIIDNILNTTSWLNEKTCPFHDFIVKEMLKKGDSIISFNYDLLIDQSLKLNSNWNYNYCLESNDFNLSDIHLLKPHGSLNWYIKEYSENDGKGLKKMDKVIFRPIENTVNKESNTTNLSLSNLAPYLNNESKKIGEGGKGFSQAVRLNRSYLFPYLVFPTTFKNLNQMTKGKLKNVWNTIVNELMEADIIYVIGFSFRDNHFNALLKSIFHTNEKKRTIKLIDKNPNSVSYVESIFMNKNITIELIADSMETLINN